MELKKNILDSLLQAVKYMPFVYPQVNSGVHGEYIIRYPYRQVPDNSLLFILPIRNAHSTLNKLVLLLPTTDRDEDGNLKVVYNQQDRREYTLVMEQASGTIEPAKSFSIIANRMAIIRFIRGDKDTAVLVNNPHLHDITVSNVFVTNESIFRQRPIYRPDDDDHSKDTPVVTMDQYNALLKRVEDLENLFIFGEGEPEEALADKPDGAMYVQVSKF